jgi:MraZ protein
MLLGEFHCTADSEGRLTIPSQFRDELVGGATLTRGIEQCVLVYPATEWEKLAGKIERQLPITSQPARTFARFIFSGAATCAPDQGGQLLLPDQLRSYARIEDEAIVVGLLSHLEIWSPRHWQEAKSSFSSEGPALAEKLSKFEI